MTLPAQTSFAFTAPASADTRRYVIVEISSSETDTAWRHRVDETTAEALCRESMARWPDVVATVVRGAR